MNFKFLKYKLKLEHPQLYGTDMDRYTDQKNTVEKKISFDDQSVLKKKTKTIKGKIMSLINVIVETAYSHKKEQSLAFTLYHIQNLTHGLKLNI